MSADLRKGSREVDAEEAARLIGAKAVRVLDVRTTEEFTALGHIPGSVLLPLDFIPCAPATLSRDGPPVLVCCEHGVRSAFA
ncbi:MAG TPA: rhodanese-like domain-containing protein, partial [Candidatus Polarisedimenticolia bacterium]|nr:rhodanese-like domain-containing protein [Candidatus Polarisedimenticolia bacterium]